MNEIDTFKRKKTFQSLIRLQFMINFCFGILPVNIDNLLLNLQGTTKLNIGISIASYLFVATISILFFGYYGDKLCERFSRKKLFFSTNFIWSLAYGLISLSSNYYFFLIFTIIAACGTGAFAPIAYSMIGDFYTPKERGNKYGLMHLGLTLGSGLGIIIGGLLGTYAGPYGWRFAYALGSIFGLFAVTRYYHWGVDPERGRAEPEFQDFQGLINYNYKINIHSFSELFKKKSVGFILVYVLMSGIAVSTLGYWGIFYLTTKINDVNAEFYSTTIYILAGIGILPGAVMGGKIGDSLYHRGKLKGRVIVSFFGVLLGVLCLLGFYLIPVFTESLLQIIFSWILFLTLGFLGNFLVSLSNGNIYAIYSEVCVPEMRSTANALNGLMVNIGGIIGNLLLASLIEKDISLLPFAISLVLFIWFLGASLWIIPYFYYPKELKQCRDLMLERRSELNLKLK
jgi:MFS family permease